MLHFALFTRFCTEMDFPMREAGYKMSGTELFAFDFTMTTASLVSFRAMVSSASFYKTRHDLRSLEAICISNLCGW
jgi:hypothetical protein